MRNFEFEALGGTLRDQRRQMFLVKLLFLVRAMLNRCLSVVRARFHFIVSKIQTFLLSCL
ncbi:protein of unknown function [Thermococcus nautili]|nr:protein of unknown function [Thermococcus nautili]